MEPTTQPSGGGPYSAGDVVKLRIVLDHRPRLKEVRLVFAHEADEDAIIVARVVPNRLSDATDDGWRRSRLDAEIAIPRGRPPGVYRLARIGYETSGGRLGHLPEGGGVPETAPLAFEVVREPADQPVVVEVAFREG